MAERRTKVTACTRDCPDACSIVVTVENGRAIRLQGEKSDPVTQGFLCYRTSRFLHRQYRPDRFTTPMLRENGRLVAIGWDEALDLAAEKLEGYRASDGAASILHYRSGGSLGILKAVPDHFFECFGPTTIKRGDICSGAGETAQVVDFGVSDSHDLHDLANSRTIVNWGKNPHASGVHLLPLLKDAKARGAFLVTIDPIRTKCAEMSDLYLQPRPGGDYALAMGVARWLLENDAVDPDVADYVDHLDGFRALALGREFDAWARDADVPVRDLAALAERYGREKPGAILVGWGLGRRANGATSVRAIDAVGAISGNLGIPGGGVSYYFGRRTAFDQDFNRGIDGAPRTLPEARLGPEILAAEDPPIRMIWVTAGNPVSMLPEAETVRRAFLETPFTVVVDTHPTDTTDVADLVLPTLTLLEDDDVVGVYGNHYLRLTRPAIPPPGEARHEVEIFRDLARRVGIGGLMAQDVDGWKRTVMRRLEAAGVGVETLARGPVRNPFAPPVLFADRKFPTPTGRVNLMTQPAAPAAKPDADRPMTLLAASTPKGQASQWAHGPGEVAPVGLPEVRVHPSVAAPWGDGAPARLESAHGSLRVVVRGDPAVRPDVALMEKGGMRRDGHCTNALIEAAETDLGGGACYYDQPVRLVADEPDPTTTATADVATASGGCSPNAHR